MDTKDKEYDLEGLSFEQPKSNYDLSGLSFESEKKNSINEQSNLSTPFVSEVQSTEKVSPYAPPSISEIKRNEQENSSKYEPLPLKYNKTLQLKNKYGIVENEKSAYAPENIGEIPVLTKHKEQISENNKILQTIDEGVKKQNDYLKYLEQEYNNTPVTNAIERQAKAVQYNNIIQQKNDFIKDYNDLSSQNKTLENVDARTQDNLNKVVFDQLSNTKLFKGKEENVNIFFDALKKTGNYTDEQIEKAKLANSNLQKIGIPVKTTEQALKDKEEKKQKETSYLGSMLLALNESVDRNIIAPIDAAAKIINTLTFGGLEMPTPLDATKKQIQENPSDRFTEIGKYGESLVAETKENNVFGSSKTPNNVAGQALTGLASLPPMLITMPLFEGVPLGEATSDMLNATEKIAPAFASQMGTIDFLNKYGETGNVLESTKEGLKGVASGATMHLIGTDIGAGKAISRPTGSALDFLNKGLGVNSESVSKLAEDIYKGKQLSKVSNVLANGGIFGTYSTAEEFAKTQNTDSRTFWSNTALGAGLAGLGLFSKDGKPRPKSEIEQIVADKIKNNAVVNYFSTPIEQINEVKTTGKTPEEIRTQADIIGEKAVDEKNEKKKYAYLLAQHKMNALADAVAMDNIFAENPQIAIKIVQNSEQITPEQKQQFINKINETAEAQYHAKQQADNATNDALKKVEEKNINNKKELETTQTEIDNKEVPPTSENGVADRGSVKTPDVSENEMGNDVVGKEGVSIYHGTTEESAKEIEKNGFDVSKGADGTMWFTTNKTKLENGEVGASGKGAIIERQLDESNLKLGGWDEYEKYSTDELISMGYDGLKLVEPDEITYRIYDPEKVIKKSTIKAEAIKEAKTESSASESELVKKPVLEEEKTPLKDLSDDDFLHKFLNSGFLNSVGEILQQRVDFNMSTKEVEQAIKNIKEGKETKTAQTLKDKILEIKRTGKVPMLEGSGINLSKWDRNLSDFEDMLQNASSEKPELSKDKFSQDLLSELNSIIETPFTDLKDLHKDLERAKQKKANDKNLNDLTRKKINEIQELIKNLQNGTERITKNEETGEYSIVELHNGGGGEESSSKGKTQKGSEEPTKEVEVKSPIDRLNEIDKILKNEILSKLEKEKLIEEKNSIFEKNKKIKEIYQNFDNIIEQLENKIGEEAEYKITKKKVPCP